jgi:hypothetical protein
LDDPGSRRFAGPETMARTTRGRPYSAASYDYVFGTTRVRIHVRERGPADRRPQTFVATAVLAETLGPVLEGDRPLERERADPEQALEALRCRLESSLGPRRRLSPRRAP